MVGEQADHVAMLLLLLPTNRGSARCLPSVVVDNDCCVDGEQKRICTSCRLALRARALSSTGQRVIAAQALNRRRFSPRYLCTGRDCSYAVSWFYPRQQSGGCPATAIVGVPARCLEVRKPMQGVYARGCVCVYSDCLSETSAKFVLGRETGTRNGTRTRSGR